MSENFIPLSKPSLQGNELKYVTEAIETEWVSTAGPFIQSFEENTAEYVNSTGAVAVQNGTSGLHIALEVIGAGREDEVIVPTLTFIAAVNPVKYCGAEPVFMDCDDSLCLDPNKLEKFFEEECEFSKGILRNKSTKKQIKAIVVVHVFGNMADMESILEVAEKYNIPIIEDATEAIGTYYEKGKHQGRYAGTMGTFGVFSFNGNKIMTTGGGGMIVSDDSELLAQARHLITQAKSDPLYYTHDQVGYNYRMTNLQAALGLAQLEQLESFIETKSINYSHYQEAIKKIPGLELFSFRPGIRPNYWFYAIKVQAEYGLTRRELIDSLEQEKIQARPIWDLIHHQQPYKNAQAYQIEKAPTYLNLIVNLPCSSDLSSQDVERVNVCLAKLNKTMEMGSD